MNRNDEQTLLAFLEGRMTQAEREELLDRLDADPELSVRLRSAAAGLDAVRGYAGSIDRPATGAAVASPAQGAPRRVPLWWIPAAVAATLALAVPGSILLSGARAPADTVELSTGIPESPKPSFLLVLHGRWPDLDTIQPEDARARAREYWAWTSRLAEEGRLVAAGDLRWEAGERLGPEGAVLQVSAEEVYEPEYVIGMFALRATSYEEAMELARQCPHLRYGGSISVRQVGSGFVTVPGMGDWTD